MSERLSANENEVLAALQHDEELCMNYADLERETKLPRKALEPVIKKLKALGYIDFWRGLMDDDGNPAGSGWCRSRAGNEYVEEQKL